MTEYFGAKKNMIMKRFSFGRGHNDRVSQLENMSLHYGN